MKRVRVLGLDVATVSGWCRYDGSRYVTGTVDCSPLSRDEPEGIRFHRFSRAVRYLFSDVRAVVIERTYSKGSRTAEILNGLTAIALAEIETRGLEYAFVHAVTLKKFATGEARADKAAMIAAAELATGLRDLTDDEADAVHLVRFWEEHLKPASPATRGTATA